MRYINKCVCSICLFGHCSRGIRTWFHLFKAAWRIFLFHYGTAPWKIYYGNIVGSIFVSWKKKYIKKAKWFCRGLSVLSNLKIIPMLIKKTIIAWKSWITDRLKDIRDSVCWNLPQNMIWNLSKWPYHITIFWKVQHNNKQKCSKGRNLIKAH